MADTTTAQVILRDIQKTYGDNHAVKDLNLEIAPGEFFGFLGPNGAGKTTTIRMLTGLTRPTSGQILICGIDIVEYPRDAKQVIGYVPDKPFLFEKLTAREFLNFTAGLYGFTEDQIREQREYFLQLFELDAVADELLESYSHGMRQKVLMTAAYIHRPKVLIVDEPMVGLDPRGSVIVKRVLKNLAKQGTTIFMSTHSLEVAQELCDRIGIIYKGEMIALGTLEQLQQQASRQHTKLETLFLELTGGDDFAALDQFTNPEVTP